MTSITCPECLAQIEEGTLVCPNCGHVLATDTDDTAKSPGVEVYVEERRWTFGNTLIALLLTLLIAAIGYFLYLNGLKWPYEDAVNYYTAEKQAYEQQLKEYQEAAAKIEEANGVLDAKIASLRAVLNSGEEPLDRQTAANATEVIQRAQNLRVSPPVIQGTAVPAPAKDSIFHAKEIRETARLIDQQRYSLYQQYSGLQIPDYSEAMGVIDQAREALELSIQQKKESEGVTRQLKELLDRYQSFMDEYITFMTIYDRSDPAQIERAEKLQTEYISYLRQISAINPERLSETDLKYFETVTGVIDHQMAENNLTVPDIHP